VTAEMDNIVLEHRRAIRGDMARMMDRIDTISAEMSAMRQHMAAMLTIQQHDHSDIANIKVRLERIEKRLDLVD
jgi:hypothetical protein